MNQLPKEVVRFLDGEQLLQKQHDAMHFITVGESGYPYKAMLSIGEVLCIDPDKLRIGLWPQTTTAKNAVRTQKATLLLVLAPLAYDIQLELESFEQRQDMIIIDAVVKQVKVDQAPYAHLTSGVRYQLNDPEASIMNWIEKLTLLKN
ncbi:hypothetical protein [Bacillus sp. JCM 19041]|uniref:hypothetical protein n=1 Tax=Bacillus sp. JCM 19041 TaxID=1460637 RepID=UPI0006CFB343